MGDFEMRQPIVQDAAVTNPVWDEQELTEIVDFIEIDWQGRLVHELEKFNISNGRSAGQDPSNCWFPFQWVDMENQYKAVHVALSNEHVMYMVEKYSVHVLNPCPPCLCCVEGMWRDDFQPKVRKLIPFEKITDIEVQEAGFNELLTPNCCTCPPKCNPVSIDVPISKTMINTAGSQGPELIIDGIKDASAFRRRVMGLKRTGPQSLAPRQQSLAPRQQSMGSGVPEASVSGGDSEAVTLLKNIASSNNKIVELLSEQQAGMRGSAKGAPTPGAETFGEKNKS